MTRPRGPVKSRLNLEMAQVVRGQLERLQSETGADSMTEVVRRALLLYELVVGVQKGGGQVVFRDDAGERVVIIL